jgi:hypothetical protein
MDDIKTKIWAVAWAFIAGFVLGGIAARYWILSSLNLW